MPATNSSPVIVWFRQDLRLADNPALCAAAETGRPVLPVYVLDDVSPGRWKHGAASRWWLCRSLAALDASLEHGLCLLHGKAEELIPKLVAESSASAIFWNCCYEPWRIASDERICARLTQRGCNVSTFQGSLIAEPQSILKDDGTPYRVFTPFYRAGYQGRRFALAAPLPAPEIREFAESDLSVELASLSLLPQVEWYRSLEAQWTPGEDGAGKRLERFLDHGLRGYRTLRDRPDLRNVSRLSPHLHFGELSPRQVWHGTLAASSGMEDDANAFVRELAWREFSYYLLYHRPELPEKNLQSKFDDFPWMEDGETLTSWEQGMTGIPMVDAGMRELWQTGFMHNRVRMLTASFLVKNLLHDWRHGAAWFWDTLVDADVANNSAGWQWVAGCGADAAPYFRIFNPVTQGRKFDPEGVYVRRFIPELAALPDKFIHAPWEASSDDLRSAGIKLGEDYPQPIVDLMESRQRALDASRRLKAD